MNHLIVDAHSLIKVQDSGINIANVLKDNINETIIIGVNHQSEFKAALKIIKHIRNHSKDCNVGISINILDKKIFALLYSNLNEIKQIPKFTIRIKKKYKLTESHQLLKHNTFYKWAVYSLVQLTTKHQIKLLVQSHNLHDISWLLLLRAQRNLESQVQFEINASKHPNIAKILMIINKFNIQSELAFIDTNNKEILNIIINKLKYQAGVYQLVKNCPYNVSQMFVKSHRQFFNFLKRNYIKLFLKK